jgi:hypothetical protein
MYRDVVLNANSSDAWHINPGLNRNYIPWIQYVLLSARHAGLFVHLQSQPMSGAVHEIPVQPVTLQNVSGGCIDLPTGHASFRRGDCGPLGFLNRAVPSAYTRRSPSNEDSPRNIATIVAEYNTQVQYHQFIFAQPFFRGPRMRMR